MAKKMFILASFIGLVVSSLGDLAVLDHNKKSHSSGSWIHQTYAVAQAIDAVKIEILISQVDRVLSPHLAERIQALQKSVQNIPAQAARAALLSGLNEQDILTRKQNPGRSILAEMTTAQMTLLNERLLNDESSDTEARNQIIFANAMDILLLLMFLGFFLYERRRAHNLQRALANTLVQVEESNLKLQLTLATRDSNFKTVVHDLKNPLGSIRGFAELMSFEPHNRDSVLEMAKIIQKVSNNTLALVGSVLKSEEEDVFPREKFNLMECLEETCTFLNPIAGKKNQKINLRGESGEYTFVGSPRQVQDVFFNVIGNALKFSPRGATVFVECLMSGAHHEIRVKDQGPGFAAEDFPKLFSLNSKLSAVPTGDEVSTGIGLYSVKLAVDSFQGQISIVNNPDRGACVSILFPRHADLGAGLPPC